MSETPNPSPEAKRKLIVKDAQAPGVDMILMATPKQEQKFLERLAEEGVKGTHIHKDGITTIGKSENNSEPEPDGEV